MKSKGQNFTELVIILALISIGGIFIFSVLGGNLTSIIGKSTDQINGFDPFGVKASGGTPSQVTGTQTIEGYQVNQHEDGSVSFKVDGQNVVISNELLNLHNTVLQTTGASSLSDLITEVGYMIKTHQIGDPPADVNVEITFGTSTRERNDAEYTGSAQANMTTIKIGNDVVILANDQTCDGSKCSDDKSGKFRIEGTIVGNNFTTTSNVQYFDSTVNDYVDSGDTFSGTYDPVTNTFNDNKYTPKMLPDKAYDWTITLDNTKQFSI